MVLIVGGGIGGLACAQGLIRCGIDVRVVESDQDVSTAAGYKLHLGFPTVQALRDLLTVDQFELLLSSAVATRGFVLTVRDHRGRRLLRAVEPSDGLTLDVDRTTLRRILAGGLEDRLLRGRSGVGWQTLPEKVVGELDDGQRLEADVLVLADGAGSGLVERLAGHPTSAPCGLVGVAGVSPWEGLPSGTRGLLAAGPMLSVGPGGTGLFATFHDPVGQAAVRTGRPSVAATTAPTVIWGLLALDGAIATQRAERDGGRLRHEAVSLLRAHHWTTRLSDLITRSNPVTVSGFRLNAADPDHLAPWPASRVTALGDAVHVMPPTGGQGAAAAILDAHVLTRRLQAAHRGETTAVVAVHDYEAEMRPRAATAVRESLQPLGWIRAAATPVGSLALRGLTPVAAGVAAAATKLRTRR